jgi:type VI secretion system secreted protein VgrG
MFPRGATRSGDPSTPRVMSLTQLHALLPVASTIFDLVRRLGSGTPLPPVEFEFDLLDGDLDELAVHQFQIEEGLNRPYSLKIEIVSDDLFLEPQDLIGHRIRFSMIRQTVIHRYFGFIDTAELVLVGEEQAVWQIEVIPAFALLDRGKRSRIWQDMSVKEIIDEVLTSALKPFDAQWDWRTMQKFEKREACTQYNESDLAFVSRLFAEEGIAYFFEADPAHGCETLVLIDHSQALPKYRVHGKSSPLDVHAAMDDLKFRLGVSALRWRRKTSISAMTVSEFDWLEPTKPIVERIEKEKPRSPTLTIEEHEGQPLSRKRSNTQVQRRLAAYNHEHARAQATTNLVDLFAGAQISFEEPHLPTFGGTRPTHKHPTYCVLSMRHVGHNPQVLRRTTAKEKEESNYSNSIVCVLAEPGALAQEAALLRVGGPILATVVDENGEEKVAPQQNPIVVDEHGRVRVRLHWMDRDPSKRQFCAWLRVAQSWAGNGYGAQFLPRVGESVVVGFLHGDPDRPFVMGSFYDGAQPPIYDPTSQKSVSGWKTQTPMESTGHELRFDDTLDAQCLHIHSSKDLELDAVADLRQTVAGDASSDIGGSETVTVANSSTRTIKGSSTTTISKDATTTVTGSSVHRVHRDRTDVCEGHALISATKGLQIRSEKEALVASSSTLRLETGAGALLSAGCNAGDEASPGHGEVVIKGDSSMRILSPNVSISGDDGEHHVEINRKNLVLHFDSVTLSCQSFVLDCPDIEINGERFGLNISGDIEISAGDTLKLKGTNAIKQSGGSIELN